MATTRTPLLLILIPLLTLAIAGTAQAAEPPVLLGTAHSFAVLGGSTITNTGNTVIDADLGLHPGTAVTGFPPGQVGGAMHVNDAVALQAKSHLVSAYNDAAGRPFWATLSPDVGNQVLTQGVYRTGSVPTLGLTGNLTLDAQGDPRAVFIFQIESSLTTATDSSVSLINGAQACNVYWQVGSSATIGTRTAFAGNVLALTSISVEDAATVNGRLLARNGAVTLINDTITRAQCAAGTEPVGSTEPGTGTGPGGTTGPGTGTGPGGTTEPGTGPGSTVDRRGPLVRTFGFPEAPRPDTRPPGSQPPVARGVCTSRDFTASVRLRDRSGIRRVKVYLDGKLVRRTTRTRFSLRISVRDLTVGRHRITVMARDRAGNRSVKTRRFARCQLQLAAPQFTG